MNYKLHFYPKIDMIRICACIFNSPVYANRSSLETKCGITFSFSHRDIEPRYHADSTALSQKTSSVCKLLDNNTSRAD